jgi:hypothetical protein
MSHSLILSTTATMRTEVLEIHAKASINYLLNPNNEEEIFNPFTPQVHHHIPELKREVTEPKIRNLVEATHKLTIQSPQLERIRPESPFLPSFCPHHDSKQMAQQQESKFCCSNKSLIMDNNRITINPKILQLEEECAKLSHITLQQQQQQSKLPQQSSDSMELHINTIIKGNKKKQMKPMVIKEKYLLMRQTEAALQLGFSSSTFSKRWRDSVPLRKWPYRKNSKLSNAIKVLKSMQKKSNHDHYDGNRTRLENELAKLLKQRGENLRPATIYYYDKDMTKAKRDPM